MKSLYGSITRSAVTSLSRVTIAMLPPGLGLRGKQLAPAARADVALDEFARIHRLEVDAAVAAPVALRRNLILGVRLADLLLRCRLRDRRSGCRCDQRTRGAGKHHAA